MNAVFAQARILIVDDEDANVLLLERHLGRAGYPNCKSTTDPRQVVDLYQAFHPDLILLDLMMPHLDGYAVMEQLRPHIAQCRYLPILVLTADMSTPARDKSLSMGAKDFLLKPFDITELLLRIHNLLETRFLYQEQQNQNEILEQRVQERTGELRQAQVEILERLARAAEYRDDDTGQHTQRVAQLAALIAQEFGLAPEHVELICKAAPLHDVGKIGISDLILLKPARLTPEEFDTIKTHPAIGAALLTGGASELIQLAENIAYSHHERWDGTGYPRGLRGEEIPLEGRILAIADVFDALTNERPYKKAWSPEQAREEIVRNAGTQFDPALVAAFERVFHQMQNSDTSLPAS
jgi:putative two-component system response regulator